MVTLHIMPYSEIQSLTSIGRIRKILNVAKQNKIVLLQGRLKQEEEAELIAACMEEINKEFKGIELAVINPVQQSSDSFQKFKQDLVSLIVGNTQALTVVGPSSVVKKIKQDPTKMELFTEESRKESKKKRR